jgi:hypothetical protein
MKRAPILFAALLFSLLYTTANASGAPGLAVLADDGELPWDDVVMVVILLLAFSGGTIAIINSTRRR